MSEEEAEAQAKMVFAGIDKDSDGVATLKEVVAALTRVKAKDPTAEAAELLQGKPGITFDEFRELQESEPFFALGLFAFTDTNGDGMISKKELETSLTKLNKGEDIDELFGMVTTEHEGFLSYSELKTFLSNI